MEEEMTLAEFFSKVMDIFATAFPKLQEELRKLNDRLKTVEVLSEGRDRMTREICDRLERMDSKINQIVLMLDSDR